MERAARRPPERRCRVSACGTIKPMKREFEVPGCLPLVRTTVHSLPWDLSRVFTAFFPLLSRLRSDPDAAWSLRRFLNAFSDSLWEMHPDHFRNYRVGINRFGACLRRRRSSGTSSAPPKCS
ncbi:MAG: hypothetical protein KA419_08715 [Acidobacteria bacterium]|nr:hypothetical protein [Acidobacteriota bacterium]